MKYNRKGRYHLIDFKELQLTHFNNFLQFYPLPNLDQQIGDWNTDHICSFYIQVASDKRVKLMENLRKQ
ncbi:MAG: hypothetical protein EBR01_07980 [Proteobacteria bacterium]|nr:hypothetical protein [Pseudomonadota bacterium]